MIRAVLDTNVLASGFLRAHLPDNPLGRLIRQWRAGSFTLVISNHILRELRDTFIHPYFLRNFSVAEAASTLSLLRSDAITVDTSGSLVGVATHRHDDPVLETAVAGNAAYLVTGDQELLALGTFQGVKIVTARDFLDVLDRETTTPADD